MSGKKIERWIDIDKLIRYDSGAINWTKSIGIPINFIYGDIYGELIILKNLDYAHVQIYIDGYTNENGQCVVKKSVLECGLKKVLMRPVIEDIPNIIDYLVNKDDAYNLTKGSNIRVKTKCPICGAEKEFAMCDLYRQLKNGGSYHCPMCSDSISYPNKFIRSLLGQLKINFIPEYSPDWIGSRLYDFFFEHNNIKYIIEADGGIGHGHKSLLFTRNTEDTKAIDEYKDNMAKEHNIKVIRIDCNYRSVDKRFDYIKNSIINSELNDIFDLSLIDWQECNKFAISNFVLQAIKYWNSGMKSTKEISEKMKICSNSVISYLKIGSNLGLCDYNPRKEQSKVWYSGNKPINMYKDGKFIMSFDSAKDCEKNSLELFGVKLYGGNICNSCRNKIKSYKGYTFEYVSLDNNTKLLEGGMQS